jgi:hypothetical protein
MCVLLVVVSALYNASKEWLIATFAYALTYWSVMIKSIQQAGLQILEYVIRSLIYCHLT